VTRLGTTLTITPAATAAPGADSGIIAVLRDANGAPIVGANVYFIVSGGALTQAQAVVRRTDFLGQARLGTLDLPTGSYTVRAYFTGAIPSPVNTTLSDPYYTAPAPAQTSLTVQASGGGLDTTITAGPATLTGDTVATFSFTGSGASGLTFECSLDGAAFASCTSPLRIVGLSVGQHTFAVRAVSGAQVDATPATFAWTVQNLYRARQVDARVWIERNIALAGLGDFDGEPVDGWALIGRTNGAADNGELRGFYVENGIPYIFVFNRSNNRGDRCILLAPRTLVRAQRGQTRLLDKLQDPVACPS
jgi:hypothetical protein